ncbi:chymotrypsinogen B-like [Tetranychus urticae]|uniref:Peptidase S1 domain-containing protein n=1 Tax=Tetranychus urticae TaxID=32264 RepID=T1L3C6_TETUR|nr:chymotrypsinogen B-like [Tetranychus urticae]XP_025018184.1 chymotrypsinogen B-like [Tetranychus urticae]XP_025018185.1 chymotrypsinogen B-like [Tetranychus urticae]
MTLFVSFLLLTLPIISNGLPLSHEKSQSTFPSQYNELTDQVCGRDTNPGKMPFYASIEYDDTTGHYAMCSGVLIAARWVLTEAVCIGTIMGSMRVVLGDEWNNKTIGVQDIYAHPDYRLPYFIGYMSNVSLLYLKEPVQFSRSIQPICLPEPGEDGTFHGRYGTVAGRQKRNRIMVIFTPSNVHYTSLPIDRSDDCDKFFKQVMYKNITDSFFCAGYPKRQKDACFPDRGDPFMVKVRKHWVIAGLSVMNVNCKRHHALDIYVRVEFYLDWIERTIEQHNI